MGNNAIDNLLPFTAYEDFWQFNTINDTWQQLPNHPGGKRFTGISFNIGNKGYIGLGSDTGQFNLRYSADFWEYSPSTINSNELTEESTLIVFPIPAQEIIHIKLPQACLNMQTILVECYDIKGKRIISTFSKIKNNQLAVDIDDFSRGIYTLIVSDGVIKIGAIKFLKI
jgi:hypothetical protein